MTQENNAPAATIQIAPLIGGPYAMTYIAGREISDALMAALELGDIVTLDFTGIEHVLPLCIHAALGHAYSTLGPAEADRRIQLVGMGTSAEFILHCQKGQREYWSHDQEWRDNMDAAIASVFRDLEDGQYDYDNLCDDDEQ